MSTFYGDEFKAKNIPDFVNIDSKPEVFLDFYAKDGVKRVRRSLEYVGQKSFGFYDAVEIDSRHDDTKVYTYYIERERYDNVGEDDGIGENKAVLYGVDLSKLYTIDDPADYKRVMTAQGDGIGYYKKTQYFLKETNEHLYSVYELIYGYDWVPRDKVAGMHFHDFGVRGIPDFLGDYDQTKMKINKTGKRFQVEKGNNWKHNIVTCTEWEIIDIAHGDVIYRAWPEVMEAEWINADIGYGDNIGTKGAPDFSKSIDESKFELRESSTEEHRFMEAGSKGDGYYTRVDVYEKASASVIYSFYRLKDGYPYLGENVAYGTNLTDSMPKFGDDPRFELSWDDNSGKGYMRYLHPNNRGIGYYKQVQVKNKRSNQLYWTFYELIYEYNFGYNTDYKYDNGINLSDEYGNYFVPDFIHGDYDKSKLKIVKNGSKVVSGKSYILWNITDIAHDYVVYKLAIADFDKSWKNKYVAYGENAYPEPFVPSENLCHEEVQSALVKRNLEADGAKGWGVYKEIHLIFDVSGAVVYNRYELVQSFPNANADVGYGPNGYASDYDDSVYNKTFNNVIQRPVNSDGSGIGFYKIVKMFPKIMPSEQAYICFEKTFEYGWVPKDTRHDFNVDGIPNFVDSVPEGTTVDRSTTYKVNVDGQSYYSWRCISISGYKEGVQRVVLYNPYVKELHRSSFTGDVGYGTMTDGCPDYKDARNYMNVETGNLVSRPFNSAGQPAIMREKNIRYRPNNEIIYTFYEVVETFEGMSSDSKYGSNTTEETKIWLEDESNWPEGAKATWKREQGPMAARQVSEGSRYSLWNSYNIIHKESGVKMFTIYKEVVTADNLAWWNTDVGKGSNTLGEGGVPDFTGDDYNKFVYTVKLNVGQDIRNVSPIELDGFQATRLSSYCNSSVQSLTMKLYRHDVSVGDHIVYNFWTFDQKGKVNVTTYNLINQLTSINGNQQYILGDSNIEAIGKRPITQSNTSLMLNPYNKVYGKNNITLLNHLCNGRDFDDLDNSFFIFTMREDAWTFNDSEISVKTNNLLLVIGYRPRDFKNTADETTTTRYYATSLRSIESGVEGDLFPNVSGFGGFSQSGGDDEDGLKTEPVISLKTQNRCLPLLITGEYKSGYSKYYSSWPVGGRTFKYIKSNNQHPKSLNLNMAQMGQNDGYMTCARCVYVDTQRERIMGFFDTPVLTSYM